MRPRKARQAPNATRSAPKAVPTEKEVERACMEFYGLFGGSVWKLSQPRHTMQTRGLPDLLVFCLDAEGRMWSAWHEVKRPGGKQSVFQTGFQAYAVLAGMRYLLGGLDAAKVWLQEIGRYKAP